MLNADASQRPPPIAVSSTPDGAVSSWEPFDATDEGLGVFYLQAIMAE